MYAEILCKWHESAINTFMHLIAFIILFIGLWIHSLIVMILAVVVAALGYLLQAILAEKEKPKKKSDEDRKFF